FPYPTVFGSGWPITVADQGRTIAAVSPVPDPGDMHGGVPRFGLGPRQRRRFLIDLGEAVGELPAGACVAIARHDDAGCEVEIPLLVEAVESNHLTRLRRLRGASTWLDSLVFGEPDLGLLDGLPQRYIETLRLHLWLREAVRVPTIAAVSRDPLDPLVSAGEPLSGEALALAYEIALAREDPQAATQREQLVTRWPGLTWRAERADAGRGVLGSLQNLYELRTGC